MSNILNNIFTISVFGESHGKCIGCIVNGCPSGIIINENDIQKELDKRKSKNLYTTQRNELDKVKIMSGIFQNKTTGTPILLIIYNKNKISKDYSNLMNIFRPGHSDFTYYKKYKIRDYRGGGYSSGRLTIAIVAAGAIAKKILFQKFKIFFQGYVSQIGKIKINFQSLNYINSNFFIPNIIKLNIIKNYIKNLKFNNDSCGAKINIFIKNSLIGIGNPLYNKLNSKIFYYLSSINAVKSVEIGTGYLSNIYYGSEYNDRITPYGFLTNNTGGILGGISTGQDIFLNINIKPTSSINIKLLSIDKYNNYNIFKTYGRHDPCIGLRIVPITESILALCIIDFLINNSIKFL